MAEGSSCKSSDGFASVAKEYRLVAIGRSGGGRSALGNALLGKNAFKSELSASTVTKECKFDTAQRFNSTLLYVDTPGFFDTERSQKDIEKEVVRSIAYSSPGPHAFLLVIRVDRFIPEESETVKLCAKIFGETFFDYLIVVFTHRDQLNKNGLTLETFMEIIPEDLKQIVQKSRFYLSVDTTADAKDVHSQMQDLFKKVTIIERQSNGFYANPMYKSAVRNRLRRLIESDVGQWIINFIWQKKCIILACGIGLALMAAFYHY